MQLVVHDSAFGDWILTWPLLRALRADALARGEGPVEPLWLVTGWRKARLAARYIEGSVPVDGTQPRWSRLFEPGFAERAGAAVEDVRARGAHAPGADREAAELAEVLGAARRVVSFVSRGEGAWADNVARMAPHAERLYIPPRPPEDWSGHVMDWQRAQLDGLAEAIETVDPDEAVLWPPAGDPDGPVVVHPGSGGAAKRWPRERFEALVVALREEGKPVQPVLGLVEWQQWGDVALRHWRSELGAQVLSSPGALAKHLGAARAYLGNDSGPTHLAAQLGLPTLALFGPTDPTRWAPRGPRARILAPDAPCAMDWLSVATVRDALAADL